MNHSTNDDTNDGTNDQTFSGPESTETSLSLDAITERRLRNHLTASAERVTLSDLEPSSVRRTARQRTVRRHRTVVGGVAAATVMGMVVGVQALSGGGGPELRMTNVPSGVNASDDGAAPATDPPTEPGIDAVPAQLGDPAFVWKVVDPGQANSIVSTFSSGGAASIPGLAVSTSPGRSNDYDNIAPSIWRTADGVAWEQTELAAPFAADGLYGAVSTGGHMFALGTAPGVATSEPNPLTVAVAGLDSTDWTRVELPIDTNAQASLPFVEVNIGRQLNAVADGVIAAVTPGVGVNVAEVAKQSELLDLEQMTGMQANGIIVVDDGCDSDQYMTATTIQIPSAITVPVGTEPAAASSGDPSNCSTRLLTWDELGVPAETVDAMRNEATSFFLVGNDGTVTPIESPAPGKRLISASGGPSPDFVEVNQFGDQESTTVHRYQDGTWQTIAAPFANWSQPPGRLGESTLGFAWNEQSPEGAYQQVFATLGADGSSTFSDPSTLFDPFSILSPGSGAAASGRWVTPVSASNDQIAAQGGIEFTIDGVTVRQASAMESPRYYDAATGEQITDDRIEYVDESPSGAMVFRNPTGEEIAKLTGDEVNSRLSLDPQSPDDFGDWSILTTADGLTFSKESVADLLGLEPGAVNYVPRVASDGTQVFVTVTLNERYPDDSRKQVVLVGTPIG